MPKLQADKFFYLSSDLLCIEGTDGFFKVVNPAFLKILGYSEEELLSAPITSFTHSDDISHSYCNSDIEEGKITTFVNRIKCADGNYRWFSWSKSKSADGNFIYASARDITKEKELEKKLSHAIAENQLILDSTLDMICTFDKQGRFLSVSKACIELLGYRPEELKGKYYHDFVFRGDTGKSEEIVRELQKGYEATNFENSYIRKDGSLIPLIWSARWSSEEQIMYSIARDGRQKKEQEELVVLSERRFKALVHSGSDLIAIFNQQSEFVYISPSVENLGYHKDFLKGKSPFDFIHPDDVNTILEAFQKVLVVPRVETQPFRFKDAAGNWRWIKTIATNKLDDPAIQGIVTNSTDITESLKLENEREQANARIHNLIENFTEGFILMDETYKILDFNHKAVQILNLENKIAKGELIWHLFPEAENGPFHQEYEKAFRQNVNIRIVEYLPSLKKWFEVSAYPYQSNLTVFFKDITESKIRELNIKLEKTVLKMNTNSEYSLKSILDYYLSELSTVYPDMRFAVSLINKKGTLLTPLSCPAVPDFQSLYKDSVGITPDESTCSAAAYYKKSCGFINLPILHPEPAIREFASKNSINSCWSFPIINQKDIVLATIAVFYSTEKNPTEDEDELIRRVSTFIQILIESHQTREFLEMSIERYKLVTQASKDAIYDWDILNDELYWGEGVERILGYNISLSSLTWWEQKVHPDDYEEIFLSLERLLADSSKRYWHAEYRFMKADGSYAYIKEDGFIIRNSTGKAIRMVGAMQDFTEIQEHQQQVIKQNTILREIARINSHYIRKPLANILALIEAIKAADDSDLQELIALLEMSSIELDDITRQIARKTYY